MDMRETSVIVVTGGSAGIGRAIALRFSRAGGRVAVLGRSLSGLDSAKAEMEHAGGEALAIALDVSDWAAMERAADQIASRWGGIDVWINNAMVTMFSPLREMSPDEFRRVTEVTYLGYVHGTMAALRHMRPENRGTIVQIGSALSYRAIPLQSAYCGAKFAIRAFTDSLRSELIHEGSKIRLTMIQLPAVNTPQFNWARNRFPCRPQPVPPVFQPEAIAEIVYRAAHKPPRELWLGLSVLKTIVGAGAAPGLLDYYLAKHGYDAQLTSQKMPDHPRDNLFEAAPDGHFVHGRFSDIASNHVLAIDPSVFRMAIIAGAALLLAGLFWLALI